MAISKVKLSDNNVKYTKTINDNFSELDTNKVDKVEGKGLSTNDYTNAEKTKLSGIQAGAQVNIVNGVEVYGIGINPDANGIIKIQEGILVSGVNGVSADETGDVRITGNDIDGLTDAETGDTETVTSSLDRLDTKLRTVEQGAQVNTIETVKVNGTALTPDSNKAVDITVPTAAQINSAIDTKLADYDTSDEVDTKLADYTDTETLTGLLNGKVDKVTGKGLSTEDFTTAEKTKLGGVEAGAQVNIIETVKVNGTALTPDVNKGVNVVIPAASEYTVAKQATAESGYSATYYLTKDGTQIGEKINIPKDLVVESGEVKTVTTADVPYEGAKVGDKYIDLTIANASNQHIYIPVKDLVDVYTAGNGIQISASNVVSAKIDATNANGLSAGANGIALATATTSTAGAMSASDKTKLDGIEANADVNIIETVKVNGTALTPDANKSVDVSVPTKIFSKVKVGNTEIEADSTTDTLELVGGTNVTLTPDATNDKVTIDVSIPASTLIQTKTFTSAEAGWGSVDSDGNFTLELTFENNIVPVVVKKVATLGGYEDCMVGLRHNAKKVYITADEKFDGVVYFYNL